MNKNAKHLKDTYQKNPHFHKVSTISSTEKKGVIHAGMWIKKIRKQKGKRGKKRGCPQFHSL